MAMGKARWLEARWRDRIDDLGEPRVHRCDVAEAGAAHVAPRAARRTTDFGAVTPRVCVRGAHRVSRV
jgi:hypothetical protein